VDSDAKTRTSSARIGSCVCLAVNTHASDQTGSVHEVVLDVRGSGVQLEVDFGLTADAGWDMAGDREVWTAQRPVATGWAAPNGMVSAKLTLTSHPCTSNTRLT